MFSVRAEQAPRLNMSLAPTRLLIHVRIQPACRRLPVVDQGRVLTDVAVARPIVEDVMWVGGARTGRCAIDEAGRHARFQHQLRAVVAGAIAMRAAQEGGAERSWIAERRQWLPQPAQGETL